jgi:hypothetical protein
MVQVWIADPSTYCGGQECSGRQYELCAIPRTGEVIEFSGTDVRRVTRVRYQPGSTVPILDTERVALL